MDHPSEATPPSPLSADSVREQLRRVIASRYLASAPTLGRLLTHLVERTLEGRGTDLKEYSLGVDVFDRGPSFDPRLDTIVRVQARRLRVKLKEYYEGEGRHDSVIIELPKGGYIPQFTVRDLLHGDVATTPASAADPTAPQTAVPEHRWERRVAYAAGVLLLGGAVVAAVLIRRGPTPSVPSGSGYTQLTDFTDSARAPSLSPDGRMVTFIRGGDGFLARGQVYVKALPNGEAVRLTNTPAAKLAPVFTPEGSRVSYTEVAGRDWDTWVVPVTGGEPRRTLPNASGLVWLDQDHVLFSEFKPPPPHLGIVTTTQARTERREVYFPSHNRAMAHFSYPSPDRKWVLVVEMDPTGIFGPCRLVPFSGDAAGHQTGPVGKCTSAAWSPDGQWMYFAAEVAGHSHLWRQRFTAGDPKQITFGPTEEDGIALAADGRSLITSVGQRQSAIWIHDGSGDRAVTTEGFAFGPRLSRDGRRVHYLIRQGIDSHALELRSIDIETGRVDQPLPGIAIADTAFGDYDVSPDGRQVVYVTKSTGDRSTIWLAQLDRSAPPRVLHEGGGLVSFGPHDDVFFVSLEARTSYFARIRTDGSHFEHISHYSPIVNRSGVSPDGEWAILFATEGESLPATFAVPVHGGAPRRLCTNLCSAWWSADGKAFFLNLETRSRTLMIPLDSGQIVPEVPASGFDSAMPPPLPRGARIIEQGDARPSFDASTYVYVRSAVERNLYRIMLDND